MSSSVPQNSSIQISILDQLLDDEPQNHRPDPPKSHSQTLRELRHSVRRDLENLLNTRHRCTEFPPDLKELEQSLVNYGIPDFCGEEVGGEDSDKLLRAIQTAIQSFEPRLRKVVVKVLEKDREKGAPIDRTLKFRINAILCVDPIQDPVSFDSALEVATGDFRVEATKNDR